MSMFIPQSLAGGRYTVGELIGHGGMAQVHIGTDTRLGRTVAIKIMRSDLAEDKIFLTRFRREARAVAQLNNPNIVSIYDSGEELLQDAAGRQVRVPYIVMEYIKGRTLRDIIKLSGSLSPQDAEQVMIGVLNALDYSHRMGIIHRDIKPGNIMISDQGTVKVMDFGIARALDDSSATMTQNQGVVGTAQYLSPEQARGEQVGTKSDIYSAGCVLYEMLTGKPPFTGDSAVAIAYQHVSETATPPSTLVPGLDKRWDAIAARAMSKDTSTRYDDAATFRQDIITMAHGGVPMAAVASPLSDLAKDSSAQAQTQTAVAPVDMPLPGSSDQPLEATSDLPAAIQPETGAMAVLEDGQSEDTRSRALRRQEEETAQKKRRNKKIAIAAIIGLLALAGVMFGLWYYFNSQSQLVSVPTIETSMSRTAAKEAVESAGLKFQAVDDNDSSAAKGTFTRQDPRGGTRLRKGSTVRVWFSTGPKSGTVPDVSGLSQTRAREVLTKAGFTISQTSTENSDTVAKDMVIRTDPAAGTQQAEGTSVILYISTGQTTVPSGLVGKSQASVVKTLNRKGFSTNIMQEESETVPSGSVTRVDPAEGTTVSQGSTITVYVSTGPKQVSVPSSPDDLSSANGQSVKKTFTNAGFTSVSVHGSASDPVKSVTVNGKSWDSVQGTSVPANSSVVITTEPASSPSPSDTPGGGSGNSGSSGSSSGSGSGGGSGSGNNP